LVGIEGEPLGIVSLAEAFAKAEEADIDLVEIAPNAAPPVCRLMDYGKFKYAESKRQHEIKLKQKQVVVKEVKFRLLTPLKEKKMPKMKTKSGAKKRFKFLGNGKVKRTHSHLRHILTKKTTKQKRKLRGTAIISATDVKRVRAMMPTQ